MSYEIIWSSRALEGYASILTYIDEHWTWREIKNFESEVNHFLDLLKDNPELSKVLEGNIRRGPINRLTILTYQVDLHKNKIYLLNIRSSRQRQV